MPRFLRRLMRNTATTREQFGQKFLLVLPFMKNEKKFLHFFHQLHLKKEATTVRVVCEWPIWARAFNVLRYVNYA